MARTAREALDEVIRDLDLVVYRLELRAEAPTPEGRQAERAAVRREIDRLLKQLEQIAEKMP